MHTNGGESKHDHEAGGMELNDFIQFDALLLSVWPLWVSPVSIFPAIYGLVRGAIPCTLVST